MTFWARKQRRDVIAHLLDQFGDDPGSLRLNLKPIAKAGATAEDALASDLVGALCSLELAPADALTFWHAMVAHHAKLSEALGRPVDLRVVAADLLRAEGRRIEVVTLPGESTTALTDGLTQLISYRVFHLSLGQEISRSMRFDASFAIVLIDLDDFATLNAAEGKEAGDEALQRVASILLDNTRNLDLVARHGGDEFALLLPGEREEGARILVDRLVDRVREANLREGAEQTASAGVACYPDHGRDSNALLSAADAALHAAKAGGKNRAEVATPPPAEPEDEPEVSTLELDD